MARSIDEILRGLRGLIANDESIHTGDKVDADAVHHAIQKFADELDEAWKRQMSQSWHHREMAELVAKHEKEVAELKRERDLNMPVGNAAAWRKALEDIRNLAYEVQDMNSEGDVKTSMPTAWVIDIVSAALAKTARNCDEYDCKSDAEVGFVEQTGETDANPLYWQLLANWLFNMAKKRKGEGDEQK